VHLGKKVQPRSVLDNFHAPAGAGPIRCIDRGLGTRSKYLIRHGLDPHYRHPYVLWFGFHSLKMSESGSKLHSQENFNTRARLCGNTSVKN